MEIRVVTVIGANGTMGKNVAAIFASFGSAKVHMICRERETAQKAKEIAELSVKAEAIGVNMVPGTYDDLKECIPASDLVFESVSENISIKKEVYAKIASYIQPHTVVATGTSGISINELSQCLPENVRKNYMGIHMFNPPYNMPLCELISSEATDQVLMMEIKQYLEKVLLRNVVRVKDAPAFMGNRIGFQFINEALQYAQRYQDNGGIDYIDSILGPFTGRNMPPLMTSDFVGLDVHRAIVDNIYQNTDDYAKETFVFPEFAQRLVEENKLGRKTGSGLYRTVVDGTGKKMVYVYDIATRQYRLRDKQLFPFAKKMIAEFRNGNYKKAFKHLVENRSLEAEICLSFLLRYVIYCIVTAKAIGEDIHSADDVMAYGFNWAPPLSIIDALGGVEVFKTIVFQRLQKEYLEKIDMDYVLDGIVESAHDYRPFFKARG